MASVGDRVWKVTVTGYVIQKEYMDEPNTWDTLDPIQWDDFVDVPNIEYTELVEPKLLETTKEDWDSADLPNGERIYNKGQ